MTTCRLIEGTDAQLVGAPFKRSALGRNSGSVLRRLGGGRWITPSAQSGLRAPLISAVSIYANVRRSLMSKRGHSSMPDTTVDEIIAALHLDYTPGLSWNERKIRLTGSDVEKWSAKTGLLTSVLYEALALKLALGFNSNTLDFGFCDQVVNELHGVIILRDDHRPPLFWSVFLAFDAANTITAAIEASIQWKHIRGHR
jgi:hypothetical protein